MSLCVWTWQTLGSIFRMCAFILLLIKVRSTRSAAGVSLKTLQLCVRCARVAAAMWL